MSQKVIPTVLKELWGGVEVMAQLASYLRGNTYTQSGKVLLDLYGNGYKSFKRRA